MSEPRHLTERAIAGLGLLLLSPVLGAALVASALSTKAWPVYSQVRIGRNGDPFRLYKMRSMRDEAPGSTVTVANDPRITRVGKWLRKTKLDEVIQLANVVRGDMRLVGPRPDVPGFADALAGNDRLVLSVHPGITSPAAILMRDEEKFLAEVPDPEWFNRAVLYPAKTRLNVEFLQTRTPFSDLMIVLRTLLPLSLQPKWRERARALRRALLVQAARQPGRIEGA